jgi:hypothetical protein
MNLFAGARRLAAVVGIGWVIAAIYLNLDGSQTSYLEAAKWSIGGIVAGWVIVFLIGWIIRGFMGIPLGLDSKTEEPKTSSFGLMVKSEYQNQVWAAFVVLISLPFIGITGVGAWIGAFLWLKFVYWVSWKLFKKVPPFFPTYFVLWLCYSFSWASNASLYSEDQAERAIEGLFMYGIVQAGLAYIDWRIQKNFFQTSDTNGIWLAPTLIATLRVNASKAGAVNDGEGTT